MKSTLFKKEARAKGTSFLAMPALVGTLLTFQPGVAIGAEVLSCFYECKPIPTAAGIPPSAWMETTTLMIGNASPPPDLGAHINTHIAHILFLDGNERPILRTRTALSGWDLDEVHVCRTLRKAGVAVPPAGLIQIGIQPLSTTPTAANLDSVDVWMKNLLGRFGYNDDDPFVSGRVTSLGKTNCNRVTPALADKSIQQIMAAPVQGGEPILIEKTADDNPIPFAN